MRVPLAQSTTRSAARAQRLVGVARAQLGGQPGQPRGEREDLHAAAGAHQRVQEQQQRARVGLHRARDVAEHDELARRLGAAAERALHGVAAGGQRAARQARAGRGPGRAGAGAAAASGGAGARWRSRRSARGPPRAPRGVIAAKSLRRRTSCALQPTCSGSPSAGAASAPGRASRRTRCACGERARVGARRGGGRGGAQEPGGGTRGRRARAPRGAPRAWCAATSRRRPGGSTSTWSSAAQRVGEPPGPTSRPASRRTRPKVTTWRANASLTAGRGGARLATSAASVSSRTARSPRGT